MLQIGFAGVFSKPFLLPFLVLFLILPQAWHDIGIQFSVHLRQETSAEFLCVCVGVRRGWGVAGGD